MIAEYKLVKKSVNSKPLFIELHKFVDEGITTGEILWSNDEHRQSFVEVLGDYLSEFESHGFIDQWNVISDFRNNKMEDMDKGIYIIEISYRQKNCLNTTRLIYTVKDLLIANIKDLIDFELMP